MMSLIKRQTVLENSSSTPT